jgi:hypothetical protein
MTQSATTIHNVSVLQEGLWHGVFMMQEWC